MSRGRHKLCQPVSDVRFAVALNAKHVGQRITRVRVPVLVAPARRRVGNERAAAADEAFHVLGLGRRERLAVRQEQNARARRRFGELRIRDVAILMSDVFQQRVDALEIVLHELGPGRSALDLIDGRHVERGLRVVDGNVVIGTA